MKSKFLYTAFVLAIMFCVITCENENQTNQTFSGKMISHSACKSKKSTTIDSDTPDTLSCVEYNYEASTGKLILKHINAGFNCCPQEINGTVTLNNDTIIIEEKESGGFCDCECLFDLDFEVTGLEAKTYVVRFIEPLWNRPDKLIFNVDLSVLTSDSYCMVRKNYPWIEFSYK